MYNEQMMNRESEGQYEVIVFSDDWFGLPFSCKHLLKHFLPEIPLVWVETIGLRSPAFNVYDFKRTLQKISGWFSPATIPEHSLPGNLTIIDPFQIPYNQFDVVRRINMLHMINCINKLAKKESKKYRVMLTTWPFLGSLIGHLGEHLSVYYRVDDFSEFPGVRKDLILSLEEEIINKSDMIIGSAESLVDFGDENKVSRYLPHGVDYEHFAAPRQERPVDEYLNISSPRIGFFGLLNSWLDLELVWKVAQRRQDWSFVFLGPSQLPENDLPKSNNIHYWGAVEYEKLPTYASLFDCALIPFKINKLTVAVNPLKLMEYLALGLPVISTPLPEVRKHEKHVYIAADPVSFENAIHKALAENNKIKELERKKIAQNHSWNAHSTKLRCWIEEALEKKLGDD
jgi:glycosyltransferase involved in cell wall biosynthesis